MLTLFIGIRGLEVNGNVPLNAGLMRFVKNQFDRMHRFNCGIDPGIRPFTAKTQKNLQIAKVFL
jgi:hypothetical protein